MARMAAGAEVTHQQNRAKINAARAARGACSIEEAQKLNEKAGCPLVQLVERNKWTDFGFLLFRLDYSDNIRWAQFLEEFHKILDDAVEMAALDPTSGLDRIKEKAFIPTVEDDVMLTVPGVIGIASAFRVLREEEAVVGPGYDTRMCLMADAECIASILEPKTSIPPFVKAVDSMMGNPRYVSQQDENYPASFKVAIHALFTDFYMALHEFGHPSELLPFADPVWEDTLGKT